MSSFFYLQVRSVKSSSYIRECMTLFSYFSLLRIALMLLGTYRYIFHFFFAVFLLLSPSLSLFCDRNVASPGCHDAAWMFFVSEMFLVKASRPTRCHLLSLSCLSYVYTPLALTGPVATTFLSLSFFLSLSLSLSFLLVF